MSEPFIHARLRKTHRFQDFETVVKDLFRSQNLLGNGDPPCLDFLLTTRLEHHSRKAQRDRRRVSKICLDGCLQTKSQLTNHKAKA